MRAMKCPMCGKETMFSKVVPNYATKLGGLPVEIPEAHVRECTNCGEISVSAKELKRWEQIQQEKLRGHGQIPSAQDVKRIREFFGLTVSDFAFLLGVTRQTIYAWERPGLDALQLGPAALLLGLLADEADGRLQGILATLVAKAESRGPSRVFEKLPAG